MSPYLNYYKKNANKINKNKFIGVFNQLLEEVKLAHLNKYKRISIKDFYSFYTVKHNQKFEINTEQDSLEFTRNFLDSLSRIIMNNGNMSHSNFCPDPRDNIDFQIQKYEEHTKRIECPFIVENFYNFIITSFICKNCNYTTYKHEHFLDLPLYFSKSM